MTREYTHDDICRGSADGCSDEQCLYCERVVDRDEIVDGQCRECRMVKCANCGTLVEPEWLNGGECDDCWNARADEAKGEAA